MNYQLLKNYSSQLFQRVKIINIFLTLFNMSSDMNPFQPCIISYTWSRVAYHLSIKPQSWIMEATLVSRVEVPSFHMIKKTFFCITDLQHGNMRFNSLYSRAAKQILNIGGVFNGAFILLWNAASWTIVSHETWPIKINYFGLFHYLR